MPMVKDCPLCGTKQINHGFDMTNGGIYFYHNRPGDPGHAAATCIYYEGDDGKVYRSALDLFRAVVEPRTPKTVENKLWIAARIADISGQRKGFTGNGRRGHNVYRPVTRLFETDLLRGF